MTVKTKIFKGNFKPWEEMFNEASQFASSIEPDDLITISTSASGGTPLLGGGGERVVVVWYWDKK